MKLHIHLILSLLLALALCLGAFCSAVPGVAADPDPPTDSHAAERVPARPVGTTLETDRPDDSTPAESPTHLVTLEEGADAGQAYQDKIIFVGDSTTHHLKNRAVLPGGKDTKQVWTPTSGTLTLAYACTAKILCPDTDTEMTIMDAAGLRQPEIMVITLGMNGISFMDEAAFKSVYATLINGVRRQSPDTKIILQSIYPREAEGNENYASITQDMIDNANMWVCDLAQDCGVYYLDTQTVLKDENGFLQTRYGVGDGIHISREGYNTILHYIRTHPIPDEIE